MGDRWAVIAALPQPTAPQHNKEKDRPKTRYLKLRKQARIDEFEICVRDTVSMYWFGFLTDLTRCGHVFYIVRYHSQHAGPWTGFV